jgi:multicomponent Na+:H+ antiporter subunit B
MVARVFAILAVVGMAVMLVPFVLEVPPTTELSPVAEGYVTRTPEELGAQNVVTAVIVTYRGLDTLGEVTVLFIATAGIGFLLRRSVSTSLLLGAAGEADAAGPGGDAGTAPSDGDARELSEGCAEGRRNAAFAMTEPSEILASGAQILIPLVLIFGVYIFLHGHLTPGGGFQGGVLLAAAALLHFLSARRAHLAHEILTLLESLSGGVYVLLGVLGLVFAAGFLDARVLPTGEFGRLVSAGAIPVIYSLIGLKVGAELTGILERLRSLELHESSPGARAPAASGSETAGNGGSWEAS